uniref:Cation efflux protein cytoplasmic domain-containing protein n=1 Tax=Plectus sambesii TaxID=2011161 RepID=A0A914W252_9BILA
MDESHASPNVPLLSNGNAVNADACTVSLATEDEVHVPEDPSFLLIDEIDENDDPLLDPNLRISPQKQANFTLYEGSPPTPTSPSPSAGDVRSEHRSAAPTLSAPPFSRNLSEPTGGANSKFGGSSTTKRLQHPSGGRKTIPEVHTEPTLHTEQMLNGSDSPPLPCTSPSPRVPPKKVRKYYQQQTELLENYKADTETIQEFERKRHRTASDTDKLAEETDGICEKSPFNQIEEENVEKQLELDAISRSSRCSGPSSEPRVKMARGRPHGPDEDDGEKEASRHTRRLAAATLLVNVILLIAKAVAVYLSGSFSIISSLVDSSVDITSGLAIWLTARAIKKRDPYLYPRGRTRLEPIALVIVSVIMGVASVQMIMQSLEAIIRQSVDPEVDLPTICIMLSTIVIKFVLMIICRRFSHDSSINVLAQDHRNDCISNSVALLCAFLASRYWIYLDPIGAILVSIYIAGTWFMTGKEHIIMLSGRTADPGFINRIIKVCMDHDKRIEFIDTVYVYHYGTKFLVEVHVVMDRKMTLQMSHDISEQLQINIEHLPEVERAFVHCDYEVDHRPEDEHKVV